ncbi:transducin family protein / WD-40 repeat family protein [Striga hermonthica]|uniref:Transducin family protein / WD-40 repeat family protein n=1 Tax=Striga hermonthica TaxID=68872 RepID=A0A9N7NAP4_STRHE|nr:transducin family protein / WD-40 repeat family protein [Striga hermonthica]
MVKIYYRYKAASAFGVIVSVDSNITYDSSGKHLLAAALEKLAVWHVRQGSCIKALSPAPTSSSRGPSLAVTSIASSSSTLIASGYADGAVRIWDVDKGTCETTLNGHKSAVTVLQFNKLGSLIASGSKDCDIILWDVIGEAGLFRLRGHRDQVTDLVFLDSGNKLVSSSKDKFLRVWDLETQHCVQIVSGHHSEIWSIDVDPDERYLVTGSADLELRFFTIKNDLADEKPGLANIESDVGNGNAPVQNKWEVLKHFGDIQRQSKDRVSSVRFSKSGNLLACQVAGTMVEMFHMLDESEARRKAKRRVNRKVKKISKGNTNTTENGKTNVEVEEGAEVTVTVPDVFKPLQVIRSRKKICSMSFCPITPKGSMATLALSLNNNMLEFYSIESTSAAKTSAIELQGHRSDVRSVTLSSDNSLLMSTSHSAIKIWNPSTGTCLRTIDSGFGLCGLFVPGDKYAIVGTKNGTLEIIDVRSGTGVEVIEAHGGSVQSIVATADGFVTGSSDKDVKFWEYQIAQKTGEDYKHLTVSPVRNLKMNDDVVAVAVSPEGKHIAVSLLDSTVKVFFMDSLKFFLSLYGHKLPALCMDISSDGDLIVTGSADKNLKIWGLDFGDCHKSLFAHADSVMAVKFVKNTHYMFSAGRDRLVKYWDADKFELLLTLDGHHSEVWCLAVSNRGDFIMTGSRDRSIRRWDRTQEDFTIEEEKEKRLEEMLESDIDNAFETKYAPKEEVPEEGTVALAGKKTGETVNAADSIMEALDIAEEEMKRIAEHEEEESKGKDADFRPNVLLNNRSPSDHVLLAVSKVQTNDLEQALLALPFSDSLRVLSYLKDWIAFPDKVELVCRVATVLLQIHHNQLTSTVSARPLLSLLKDILHARVKECKDTLGFNLAAMDHLKQLMAAKTDAPFRDAKAKLLEIRLRHSQQNDRRVNPREERRKKKKQKKLDGDHVWS